MTEREMADDLFKKFTPYCSTKEENKKVAIICCDEIIKWNNFLKEKQIANLENYTINDYWEKVKEKIINK